MTLPRKPIPQPVYWFGDVVYLVVATDPAPGMVLGLTLGPELGWLYRVDWGNGQPTSHYDIELTKIKRYGEPKNNEDDE